MTENCKNCGSNLTGKYCAACGQKKILPPERKLSHLLFEYFHHFTHIDGKFLKTLRTIFFKPGKVSCDVMNGITVPHFQLSSLFLVGTLIYFLLPNSFTIGSSMNTNFAKQISQTEMHEWKRNFVDNKIKGEHTSLDVLSAKYNQRQHDYGKLLTLILIPLLIPVLWIINLLIKLFKRKHSITAYDLGVASLEINSIFLYGSFILSGFIIKLVGLVFKNEHAVLIVFIILSACVFYLLFLFFRRVYALIWWQALLCLALLILGYLRLVSIYSMISFLIFIQ